MTSSSTARVATTRPGRYAKALVEHFSDSSDASWDADEGRGYVRFGEKFGGGECEMIAGDAVLLLQIESNAGNVADLEDAIGRRIVRTGGEEPIVWAWKRPGGKAGTRYVPND